jgi:hypothetical protein
MTIQDAIERFTSRLAIALEEQALESARADVLASFGLAPKRGAGRPPGRPTQAIAKPRRLTTRRKAPVQLCPVPGCKNPAAPIFGMVCGKHKDVPKAKVRKFREARRAKKLEDKSRRR